MKRILFGIVVLFAMVGTFRADDAVKKVALGKEVTLEEIAAGVWVVEHRFVGGSNSLVVQCGKREYVLIDTPLTNAATERVYEWVQSRCDDPNVVAISTGFHNDNLAGNDFLLKKGVDCYGADVTGKLLKESWPKTKAMARRFYERAGKDVLKAYDEQPMVGPNKVFELKKGLVKKVGDVTVEVYYPGASHTLDNTVVYVREKKVLFGGCMVKAAEAKSAGFVADADMKAWPESVKKVLKRYGGATIVVPGHGRWGGVELLKHTVTLLGGDLGESEE